MTANELTFFNVNGFFYDVESPLPAGTTNTDQFLGLTGALITFTPRLPEGFVVLISDLDLGSGNTGSTALAIAPITGRVIGTIVNGSAVWQLAAINTVDSPGINLLANTSIISSYLEAENVQSGQLIYDVSFTQVTYAGLNQFIQNFAFVAPTTSETVVITDPSFETIPYVP